MADPSNPSRRARVTDVETRVFDVEARLLQVEEKLGQPDAPMVPLFQQDRNMKEVVENLQKVLAEVPGIIEERFATLDEKVSQRRDLWESRLDSIKTEIEVLKKAVIGSGANDRASSSKVRVPEPKAFAGVRSAKELENFIWDIESYFDAARIRDTEKVSFASMYLVGDAKLWWRMRLTDDASANRDVI